MTWTVDDILRSVEPRILARGIAYFSDGQVHSIENPGEGEWSARVEGAETYEISIQFDPEGALEHS